jgi:hypothetical protein
MGELLRRCVWFFIVASAIAYSVFLVAGSFISAQAIDASHIVQVRDALAPNVHNLSGMVMVPTTCTQLSVRTEQVSPFVYQLVFSTWKEPSVQDCENDEVPRAFRAVLFAPATGVDITATLDGAPLTLALFPVLPQNE